MLVREDKLPLAVLQERSLLEGVGAAKKVRATLRGITARRLAAHRRLIAAISGLGRARSCFFSDPVIGVPLAGTLIVLTAERDTVGVIAIPGPGDDVRGA
jgi:hypothetical protein